MMLTHQSPVALLAPIIPPLYAMERGSGGEDLIPLATSEAQWRGVRGEVKEGLGGEVKEGLEVRANEVKRLKSRHTFYVTPTGTSLKALPVETITDPLLSITAPDLAPSPNLREWLLAKLNNMNTNDYAVVPHINCIIARCATRTYAILYRGNITTIVGQSHNECLVYLMTWVTCVCCTENTIEKPQAAYLFQEWCKHFGDVYEGEHGEIREKPVRVDVKRRELFLTAMLVYEAEPICIQLPVLFSDMPLWELLVPQLGFGQFVNVNEICAILARPNRDEYWLLYENRLYEYIREKDDEDRWEQTTAELRDELIGKVRLLMRLQSQGVA